MIQKHSTSKFATKLKFKIYKPNKNSQCVSTNTDINKLNWRFNHIFLVITNRDFYCMVGKVFKKPQPPKTVNRPSDRKLKKMGAQDRNHISKMSRFQVTGQKGDSKKGLNPEIIFGGLTNDTKRCA